MLACVSIRPWSYLASWLQMFMSKSQYVAVNWAYITWKRREVRNSMSNRERSAPRLGYIASFGKIQAGVQA